MNRWIEIIREKISHIKITYDKKQVIKIALGVIAAILIIALLLSCIAVAKLSAAIGDNVSFGSLLVRFIGGDNRLTDVTNILLLGVDNDRSWDMDARGNADGIMLVSINPKTRELILTSFMRDTKVSVDNYTRDKLTNVYHEHGIEVFKEVFENNFGIHVDNYAIFNYLDIIDIVDCLGGIEVDIAEEEIPDAEAKIRSVAEIKGLDYTEYLINWYGAGRIKLNGVQVAGYMRIRPAYGEYDSGRTSRARYVATELMDKLCKKSLAEQIDIAAMILSKIETDVDEDEILKFALNAGKISSYDRISDRIPIDGGYTDQDDGNGYYAVPDFEVNNAHLQQSIYQGIHDSGE